MSPFMKHQCSSTLGPSPLIVAAFQSNLESTCGVQGLQSAGVRCGFLVTGFWECLTWQNDWKETTSMANLEVQCRRLRCIRWLGFSYVLGFDPMLNVKKNSNVIVQLALTCIPCDINYSYKYSRKLVFRGLLGEKNVVCWSFVFWRIKHLPID